jgi:hypothetical protein
MKTIWTSPGRGNTLAELLMAGNAAFPKFCGPPESGDENQISDLLIMEDGDWEQRDLERLRNVRLLSNSSETPF